jgi:hypothetical protein
MRGILMSFKVDFLKRNHKQMKISLNRSSSCCRLVVLWQGKYNSAQIDAFTRAIICSKSFFASTKAQQPAAGGQSEKNFLDLSSIAAPLQFPNECVGNPTNCTADTQNLSQSHWGKRFANSGGECASIDVKCHT